MDALNTLLISTEAINETAFGEAEDRRIADLCQKALAHPDRQALLPSYSLLKERFTQLEESGVFPATSAAKEAFERLLKAIGCADMLEFIRTSPKAFETFARAYPDKVFRDPHLRQSVLDTLSQTEPKVLFALLDLVDLSRDEALRIGARAFSLGGACLQDAMEMLADHPDIDEPTVIALATRHLPKPIFETFATTYSEKVFGTPGNRLEHLKALATHQTASIFPLLAKISPSQEEVLAMAEVIFSSRHSFLREAMQMLRMQPGIDQKMVTDLFIRALPQNRIHELTPEFLNQFQLHTVTTNQETINRFEDGICKGHALALMAQKSPSPSLQTESQARFLQAAMIFENIYRTEYLLSLGKRLIRHQDELPQLFQKLSDILQISDFSRVPPDQIALGTQRLLKDPIFKTTCQTELSIIRELQEYTGSYYSQPKTHNVSPTLQKKKGIADMPLLFKDQPFIHLPSLTSACINGNFILRIYDSSIRHAMYVSVDQLSFCDTNDRDPETLLPILRRFSSPQELWTYVYAHVHIFYPVTQQLLFALEPYLKF